MAPTPKRPRTPFQEAVAVRARELMATGMEMGPAAQQAYKEISGTQPTPLQQINEESALKSRDVAADIVGARENYVDEKAAALEKEGVQPADARARAEKEFESAYLKPVTSPYGELGDRSPGGALGIVEPAPPTSVTKQPAGLGTALRPQTTLPESAVAPEKRRIETRDVAGKLIGSGPDYGKVFRELVDGGLSEKDASAQISAMQSAYNAKLVDERQRARDEKRLLSNDFLDKMWKETVDELSGVSKALEDKASYKSDYKPTGPSDPYYLAFSKQIKKGEGVPQLTRAQGQYIASLAAAERADAERKLRDEYKDKPLVVTETEAVEGLRGGRPRTVTRELVGADKEARIKEMAAEQVETPWWTNPEEVKKRLADPEKFAKPGVFTEETAFGTQRETNLGWLARSAMLPLNAFAGFVFPAVFTGFGGTNDAEEGQPQDLKDGVEEVRRRARPQAYKDSPILLNIAEGRGFVGEAAELSRLTGLDTEKILGDITLGDVYTAGAFAADLLDPSLDILAGGAKALRVAGQVGKAAELTGAKIGKLKQLREGAKEGLKTFATENPALNLAAKRMGVAPGDVRLVIANALEKEADRALGVGRARAADDALINASPALRAADSELKALDAAISGRGKAMSRQNLAAAVGEALVRNPDIAGVTPRSSKIFEQLATNDALYEATQKAIKSNAIRRAVFESTKDSVLKSGLIAVTRKVFATQDEAKKIINAYKKSPFAKEVSKIANRGSYTSKPVTISSRAKPGSEFVSVKNGYTLTDEAKALVEQRTLELYNKGFANTEDVLQIRRIVEDGFIPTDELRKLIDQSIEETASTFKIAKSSDIAELNPIVAKELMKPIEVRDFSNPTLRNYLTKRRGLELPKQPLTASQEAFKNEVVGVVGNLDKRLRGDVERMFKDKAFREAYGVAPDAKLTREGAVGHLIAANKDVDDVAETLKLAVDKVYFQEKYVNDLFDVFSGVKTSSTTDIWSEAGRAKLMQLAQAAAERVVLDPATYYAEMLKLSKEAEALKNVPENVKFNTSEIRTAKGNYGPQTLIASYYDVNSTKAIEEAFKKIATADREVFKSLELLTSAGEAGLKPQGLPTAISRYTSKIATDPSFAQLSNLRKFAKITEGLAGRVATEASATRFLAEADDIATRILRNNGFDPVRNPISEIENVAKKALGNPELEDTVNAMLGKEVAAQIRTALSAGNSNSIQAQLSRLIADSQSTPDVFSAVDKYFINPLVSAFYTLVLTAAPRFHGANIVGAPSLIYSTTGKLLDPGDFIDSLSTIRNADTARGGKIVVTDAAGRTYTANELYRAIIERGGQSVFKTDLPSLQARTALATLDVKFPKVPVLKGLLEQTASSSRRMADWILSTPEKEDSAFRLAVAIGALKQGRTLDEATSLAKAALYDKGDITKSEERLSKLLMFYSFTRNNLVNLLKNLGKPEGLKRIANVVRTKRGVETFTVDPEERKYAPSTAATRLILGKAGTKDVGNKGIILATPPDSTLSAIELLSNIAAGELASTLATMGKPGQAIFFKESPDTEYRTVPAEHISVFEKLARITGADVGDILTFLTGDVVTPVRSNEPGNRDGYIYPILSESGRKRYGGILEAVGYLGVTRLLNEYPATIGEQGTKTAEAFQPGIPQILGTLAYGAGLVTPMKTLSAEQQRLRTLMSQNAEGRKMVKEIDDIMLSGELATSTKDKGPQSIAGAIKQGKKIEAEVRTELKESPDAEYLRLVNRLQQLEMKIAMDPMNFDVYYKEMEKITARMDEIDKATKGSKPKK